MRLKERIDHAVRQRLILVFHRRFYCVVVYRDFRVGIIRPYDKVEGGVEAVVVAEVEIMDRTIFDGVNKASRPNH